MTAIRFATTRVREGSAPRVPPIAPSLGSSKCRTAMEAGPRSTATSTARCWSRCGTPTASQTAWALLGLIAAGEADSPEVRAGVQWLLSTQRDDGTWSEEPFTGTGFPKVFYLKYHYYALYFPLMALSRYAITCD